MILLHEKIQTDLMTDPFSLGHIQSRNPQNSNVKEVGGGHQSTLQDLKQMPCRIDLKPLYHILTVII